MSDQTLTHKDLAAMLGVSETTIKSYRRKFEDCIPVASRGKPIRFTPEAGDVCLRIRDLFGEGMNIPEVRARLAEEFSWIRLVAREKKDPDPAPVALPHEFTIGISNLAKSMVTMTQQQGNILKRLRELEENVTAVPFAGTASIDAEGTPQGVKIDKAALRELLEPLARLDLLENLASVDALTDALHQATGALTEAAGALQDAAAKLAESESALAERMRRFPAGEDGLAKPGADHDTVRGTVRDSGDGPESGVESGAEPGAEPGPEPGPKPGPDHVRTGGAEHASSRVVSFPGASGPAGQAPHASGTGAAPAQEQPPRHLLSLPLVFRTLDGTFFPAAGRARGPFSINDLKALLAYGKRPPANYTMHWQRASGGWWLVLEQPRADAPRPLRLLLRELASQRGMSVAEISHFVDCDESVQPARFCAFVDEIAAGNTGGDAE